MMQFAFHFGYCTPAQWTANEKHGWDDECSAVLLISACDKDEAEIRGLACAEELVRRLFEDECWPGETPGWRESNFAFWIEEATAVHLSGLGQDTIAIPASGELDPSARL